MSCISLFRAMSSYLSEGYLRWTQLSRNVSFDSKVIIYQTIKIMAAKQKRVISPQPLPKLEQEISNDSWNDLAFDFAQKGRSMEVTSRIKFLQYRDCHQDYGTVFLPTLQTYYFHGLRLKEIPKPLNWSSIQTRIKNYQQFVAHCNQHAEHIESLFHFFHVGAYLPTALRLADTFRTVMHSFYGLEAMDAFRGRFVDVTAIDKECVVPIYLLPFPYNIARKAREQAEQHWQGWYSGDKVAQKSKKSKKKNFPEQNDPGSGFISYNPSTQVREGKPKTFRPMCLELENVETDYRHCIVGLEKDREPQPKAIWTKVLLQTPTAQPNLEEEKAAANGGCSSAVTSMLIRLYRLAFDFELMRDLNEHSNLAAEAIHGTTAEEFLKANLSFILQGLQQVPFSATESVQSLLEYLARHSGCKQHWMASQLKMGLFLANIYGRLCWFILVSSVLYTWQTLSKFSTPWNDPTQIAYRELGSFGRGPKPEDAHHEARIWFRDEDSVDQLDTVDYWYRVLTFLNEKPESNCIKRFKEFCLTQQHIIQFSRTPYSEIGNSNQLKMGVGSDLKKVQWYLARHANKRPVKFGSVFLKKCNHMSMMYRYYVFSTVTGADHLYYMNSTGNSVSQKSLYPHIKFIEEWEAFKRSDTRGVVEYYILLAYRDIGLKRPALDPMSDLHVMQKFWAHAHDGQDSLVVCLEIQQRLLYDSCRRNLIGRLREIDRWQTSLLRHYKKSRTEDRQQALALIAELVGRISVFRTRALQSTTILSEMNGGTNSTTQSNERLLFIDLVTRRYLLDCCLLVLSQVESFGKLFEMIPLSFTPVDIYPTSALEGIDQHDQTHLNVDQVESRLRPQMQTLQSSSWPQSDLKLAGTAEFVVPFCAPHRFHAQAYEFMSDTEKQSQSALLVQMQQVFSVKKEDDEPYRDQLVLKTEDDEHMEISNNLVHIARAKNLKTDNSPAAGTRLFQSLKKFTYEQQQQYQAQLKTGLFISTSTFSGVKEIKPHQYQQIVNHQDIEGQDMQELLLDILQQKHTSNSLVRGMRRKGTIDREDYIKLVAKKQDLSQHIQKLDQETLTNNECTVLKVMELEDDPGYNDLVYNSHADSDFVVEWQQRKLKGRRRQLLLYMLWRQSLINQRFWFSYDADIVGFDSMVIWIEELIEQVREKLQISKQAMEERLYLPFQQDVRLVDQPPPLQQLKKSPYEGQMSTPLNQQQQQQFFDAVSTQQFKLEHDQSTIDTMSTRGNIITHFLLREDAPCIEMDYQEHGQEEQKQEEDA